MNPDPKKYEILLVEDSPSDVLIIREALSEVVFNNNLVVVENGVAAVDYLSCRGSYKGSQRPDLILLDINLPKKNGREVLSEIKCDPNLKKIPVVVLTTSNSRSDIEDAYQLNANCYVVKPIDFDKFIEVVQSICNFWFNIVSLPTGEEGE